MLMEMPTMAVMTFTEIGNFMDKLFRIQVCRGDGIEGSETEHIVKVIVEDDGVTIGQIRLAGGDLENATGIAYGLKNLSDGGTDLMEILPEPEPMVNG